MKIRYATRDDLVKLFGSVPSTMRAIVAEDGGKIAAIAGLARMGDHIQAFSSIRSAEMRKHRVLMGRAAVMLGKMIAECAGPVFAVCNPDEPTSPGLLQHLGFRPWSEGVWRHG